jgi:translation initiation factor IF-2
MASPPGGGNLMQYLSSLNPSFLNQGGAGMEMALGGMTPQAIGGAMQSPGWNQNRFAGGPLAPGFGPGVGGAGPKAGMVPKFEGAEKGGRQKRMLPNTGAPQVGARPGGPTGLMTKAGGGGPGGGGGSPVMDLVMSLLGGPMAGQAGMPGKSGTPSYPGMSPGMGQLLQMLMGGFQPGAQGLGGLGGGSRGPALPTGLPTTPQY